MTGAHLEATTLDDLMRAAIKCVESRGHTITPSQGEAREVTGVLLELTDPRARLSRTETRGKPFSCLGELCWYLAKTNELAFIAFYLSKYADFADGDLVNSGYGPRLFAWEGMNQVALVTALLREHPDSRRAVIQLYSRYDLSGNYTSIPCTCTLQFMIRGGALRLFVTMRSNDIFWGIPHDVFCFTMLQEIIATDLGVDLGTYQHAVGSFHLYERDRESARTFSDEGWQTTESPMPPMPTNDPWSAVELLVRAEATIRTSGSDDIDPDMLPAYWLDLVRLLRVFRGFKDGDKDAILRARLEMASQIYNPFIDRKLKAL